LMCNFTVRFQSIEERFGISFSSYFARELETLNEVAAQSEYPFTRLDPDGLHVTSIGRLFVRNVCMAFDRYLQLKNPDKPVFSRTV
jgi:oxygen-independent coproporphyrinogen-3 oxidase